MTAPQGQSLENASHHSSAVTEAGRSLTRLIIRSVAKEKEVRGMGKKGHRGIGGDRFEKCAIAVGLSTATQSRRCSGRHHRGTSMLVDALTAITHNADRIFMPFAERWLCSHRVFSGPVEEQYMIITPAAVGRIRQRQLISSRRACCAPPQGIASSTFPSLFISPFLWFFFF
jgi:hypothetical protein